MYYTPNNYTTIMNKKTQEQTNLIRYFGICKIESI
jgi:hypothetical protein